MLHQLKQIAEVVAVRGNIDEEWAHHLKKRETVHAGALKILVVHDVDTIPGDPRDDGYRIVISGHTHTAKLKDRDGITYLNPGPAGRRNIRARSTLALVDVRGSAFDVRFIDLAD